MASKPRAPEIQTQAETGLLAAIPFTCFYQPFPKPTENQARKILPYETRCPFSRATRVILAVDLNKGELPFLKNYCRTNVDGMEEGKTYPFMQGENGPRIYRMTLDVVGRSLTDFQSSYQFISAIADAMEAHDVAIFDCGVLHHDISIGSIILTDDHGVLIDWDLCAKLDDDNENNLPIARRPTCIGMWQFMSAMLLTNPFIRRSYHDDRESAFYVLLWIGLRCTKTEAAPGSTYTPENVLRGFDELFIDSAGRHLGGDRKTVVLRRYRKEGIMFIECPELDSLLAELAPVFDVRYESKPTAKDMAHLKKLLTKLEVANSEDEKQSIQEILHYHVTYRYQQKMEKLEKSGWLVDTIRKYLHLGK